MKPYHVYIIWSDTGHRFYIGVTEDVGRRLRDHNAGISKWTKRYAGTWRLVWQQPSPSLSEARVLENWLKRQKGGRGFWQRTGLDRQVFRSPRS